MKWKGCGRKRLWFYIGHHAGICLERVKNPRKSHHNNRSRSTIWIRRSKRVIHSPVWRQRETRSYHCPLTACHTRRNLGSQVGRATKFCTVATNICRSSVSNSFHVTLLVPRISGVMSRKYVHPWCTSFQKSTRNGVSTCLDREVSCICCSGSNLKKCSWNWKTHYYVKCILPLQNTGAVSTILKYVI